MTIYTFLGFLTARSPIHVGSGQGGDLTDDLLRRNAEGRPMLPGTAIGGTLRTLAMRLAPRLGAARSCKGLNDPESQDVCGCEVCRLFGEINPSEDETEGGTASSLAVAHAWAELPEGATSRIQDGVGIERRTGASAGTAAAKFDCEVLPAGTRFRLHIEWEPDGPAKKDEDFHARLLAAVLAEWGAGRAWLGSSAARGLGAMDLEEIEVRSRNLSLPDRLMAFLQSDSPWENEPVEPNWFSEQLDRARATVTPLGDSGGSAAGTFARVELELGIDGPFLVSDPMVCAHSGFDHAPLLEIAQNRKYLVLPGSSLRGALRQQAERIARTLATTRADGVKAFGEICPACDPLSHSLPGDRESDGIELASCDHLARRWIEEKGDTPENTKACLDRLCLACQLFGNSLLGSRLRVESARAPLDKKRQTKVMDFLAIDRFTGGGRNHFKFDALAALDPEFKASLHLENPAEWELGWLALVLRDLAEGMLAVGFGTAKGFGHLRLKGGTLTLGCLTDRELPRGLSGRQSVQGNGLYREQVFRWHDDHDRGAVNKAAQGWLEDFSEKLSGFLRKEGFHLEADHYFGTRLENLYPKEVTEWTDSM